VNQSMALNRDCQAVEIPSGRPHLLPARTRVRVTQNLGDSYTVITERGHMLRIDARDSDALGITSARPAEAPASEFSEKLVWEQLKTIYDPEIPINIVDLGLVYLCQITPAEGAYKIDVKMSLTAPGCGMANVLRGDVECKLAKLPQVKEVHVEVVFDPPWQPSRMSEAAKLQLGLDLDTGSKLPIDEKSWSRLKS
jgi:probable FeS assembly SUF system protein SufT